MKQTLLLTVLLLIGLSPVWGQDYQKIQKQLERKQQETRYEIKALKTQIENYQEKISLAETKFERLYDQYENLKKELELRNALLTKLKKERSHIEEEIDLTQKAYAELEEKLNRLIEKYQASLTYLYKHGRTTELALLLTADSFNQMLIRSKYLEKFDEYRDEQATEIKEAQAQLDLKKENLIAAREKNQKVTQEIVDEKEEIENRQKQQEKNIASLKRNRRSLRNKLSEVQNQMEELNSTLTGLILQEEKVREAERIRIARLEAERQKRLAAARKIEDAAKREAEIAKYSKPIASSYTISPEDLKAFEAEFSKLQGQLPMPVDNGVITAKFGTRVHPVYGTKINNPGVEISVEPRTEVRAIHDGVVYAVQPIRGYGDVVLVNHGKYKTVYANLSEILVRKDTPIKAGEIIGLSGDESSTLGASIFFMIRNGTKNLNPEKWFASR